MVRDNGANFMKKIPIDDLILGIGDVARVTGVSPSQLRYWERKGYIRSTEVTAGGNRKFAYRTVIQVRQIKAFLDDGYTLASAVTRARQRGVYAGMLRSFFEQRFDQIAINDDQTAILDLGPFDPDPSVHLLADQRAGQWHFRLGRAIADS